MEHLDPEYDYDDYDKDPLSQFKLIDKLIILVVILFSIVWVYIVFLM
jgi:hypothetical protein